MRGPRHEARVGGSPRDTWIQNVPKKEQLWKWDLAKSVFGLLWEILEKKNYFSCKSLWNFFQFFNKKFHWMLLVQPITGCCCHMATFLHCCESLEKNLKYWALPYLLSFSSFAKITQSYWNPQNYHLILSKELSQRIFYLFCLIFIYLKSKTKIPLIFWILCGY